MSTLSESTARQCKHGLDCDLKFTHQSANTSTPACDLVYKVSFQMPLVELRSFWGWRAQKVSLWKGDIRVQKRSNGEMIGGWCFAEATLASPGRDAEFVLAGGPKGEGLLCAWGQISHRSQKRMSEG